MKKLCCGSVAALLFTVLYDTHAFGEDEIRMGLSSVSALHSAVWVAEQKGLFRKHGLDPEIIVTRVLPLESAGCSPTISRSRAPGETLW